MREITHADSAVRAGVTLAERLAHSAQGGRYVKLPDLGPGWRIDVVLGELVFSSCFLDEDNRRVS